MSKVEKMAKEIKVGDIIALGAPHKMHCGVFTRVGPYRYGLVESIDHGVWLNSDDLRIEIKYKLVDNNRKTVKIDGRVRGKTNHSPTFMVDVIS